MIQSTSHLRSCPQCGAAVDLPPEQLSSKCAFCASPLVEAEAAAEQVDRVAPFQVTAVQAGGMLSSHLASRWFIANSLKQAGTPDELRAVLVPFWCYAAEARSDWTARQGIYWYRTETYTTVENGETVTKTREVRETEWFSTSGTHVASYFDHLVSGSAGLPERESNLLEPFDLGAAQPYSPALLAGWTAERPTVPREEAHRTANNEIAARENQAIHSFLPADQVKQVDNQTAIDVRNLELVMLPVWIGTYKHKGEVLRLLVNGQTGEVVADLPSSKIKIAITVLTGLFLISLLLVLAIFLGGSL